MKMKVDSRSTSPTDFQWNGGIMEYWDLEAEFIVILISAFQLY
jgi:hypothetical protein